VTTSNAKDIQVELISGVPFLNFDYDLCNEINSSNRNLSVYPRERYHLAIARGFNHEEITSIYNQHKESFEIIKNNFLEKGEIGFLTIHESFVESGKSQRGYNSKGINRNVHIEVGRNNNINRWGSGSGTSWGGKGKTLLDDNTMVLIANSISNTCRLWNTKEMRSTKDGDLSAYIDSYPEHTGILMKAGELAKISIFTPHECINQKQSGVRQFLRIVGKGVTGREDYFTINSLLNI
jgi:hypothetical protein